MKTSRTMFVLASVLLAGVCPLSAARAQDLRNPFHWSTNFANPGFGPTAGSVAAAVIYDDGTGPALFVGGDFTSMGPAAAHNIAKWDGSRWTQVLDGLESAVVAMTIWDDDGPGPNPPGLYIAGRFRFTGQPGVTPPSERLEVDGVVRYDGRWSPAGGFIASHLDAGPLAIGVFDDGSGESLLVGGGRFGQSGGPLKRVGGSFQSLEGGVDFQVWSMADFDDGSGSALYVGGSFQTVGGGVPALNIARWSAARGWEPLGAGLGPIGGVVSSLAAYQGALYASGSFLTADGIPVPGVAKWTSAGWGAAPEGFPSGRMQVVSDGPGSSSLYVGGSFTSAQGVPANHVARLNGAVWTALGQGLGVGASTFTYGDLGAGPRLFAAGSFKTVNLDTPAFGVAQFDGTSWSPIAPGAGVGGSIRAFAVFDDGDGPALFAGGTFNSTGSGPAAHLARWTGQGWSAVGSGVDGAIFALLAGEDAQGPALFIGGSFAAAGGQGVANIVRYARGVFTPLGAGTNGAVDALEMFGGQLYAGGEFTSAGGGAANHLAKWDGAGWSRVGGAANGTNGPVLALRAFGGRAAPALYVGGSFSGAGPVPASNLARWDGGVWSAVSAAPVGVVRAMLVDQAGVDGSLYVASGASLSSFDGMSWRPVIALQAAGPLGITSLAIADDGFGPGQVYAGGDFSYAGAPGVNYGFAHVAGSGTAFPPFGGMQTVYALSGFGSPCGPGVWAGGDFAIAGGTPSSGVARWEFARPGPAITWAPPRDVSASANAPGASISVEFAPGPGPIMAEWTRNGAPVVDDGRVRPSLGATSAGLNFAYLIGADEGIYSVRISSPCGEAMIPEIYFHVICPGEFDGDNQLTPDDLADFISGFFGAPADPRCDWNHDGAIDPDDMASYIADYFTPCGL